jgi:hypothetical protein
MKWRWDQGRLDYLRFENIRSIARCCYDLNGINLKQTDDILRPALERATTLPFAPKHYKVWRNYGRVFECAMVATDLGGRLTITDIGKRLAEDTEWTVDEYIAVIITRFAYPYPAFQDYAVSLTPVFPFCAIIRYLLASLMTGKSAKITVEEVFSILIGNNAQGTESLDFFAQLRPTDLKPQGDEERQVREMLIFLSQTNFLKWSAGSLFLDIEANDEESIAQIEALASPMLRTREPIAQAEILSCASLQSDTILIMPTLTTRETTLDAIFTEGKRVRTEHLRLERSPRLRKLYFAQAPKPHKCDMCAGDMQIRYPWTDNILELHHLLPLSSSLTITTKGTSLADVVPLCPNCHRSIHVFYKNWLNSENVNDFRTPSEAFNIYNTAKQQVQI